jgi:hypothetical protein
MADGHRRDDVINEVDRSLRHVASFPGGTPRGRGRGGVTLDVASGGGSPHAARR